MSSIVDEIRQAISQRDGIVPEKMAPLAEEYNSEVVKVNSRLIECLQLIRKGLRSEAIQQANIKPNLLDWSAQLDFPEVDEWFEILQFLGVKVPQSLNRDGAIQLQEAINEEQGLDELLRQHRRLAIAKAPLQWRLKVLHRLHELDPANALWIEDLGPWEAVRLKAIPGELQQAIANRALEPCRKISQELHRPSWVTKPPTGLVEQAAEAFAKIEHEFQCDELRKIADELNDAFSQQATELAQARRKAWQAQIEVMMMPVPNELEELVEPAMLWLDVIDQHDANRTAFQHACEELSRAMDVSAPKHELERKYFAATQFDFEIDPGLHQRYETAIAERQLTAKRRMLLIGSSIFALTTIALVAVFAWQWQRSTQNQTKESVAAITKLLESGRVEEADKTLKELQKNYPSVAGSSSMKPVADRVKTASEQESIRSRDFQKALKSIQEAEPGELDIQAINRAKELAKTIRENDDVNQIVDKFEKYKLEQAKVQFENAEKEIGLVQKNLNELKSKPLDDRIAYPFKDLRDEVDSIRRKYPLAGARATELLDDLSTSIKAFEAETSNQKVTQQERNSLRNEIQSAKTLASLVQRQQFFVTKFPGDPLSKEYQEALREESLWDVIQPWNSTTQTLKESLDTGITPDAAAQVAKELAALSGRLNFDSFAKKERAAWEPELRSIQQRLGALDEMTKYLEGHFANEFITIQAAIYDSTKTPVRMYLPYKNQAVAQKQIDKGSEGKGYPIEVVTKEDRIPKNLTFTGPGKITEEPRATMVELAKKLKAIKASGDWESQMIALIGAAYSRPGLDATIKEMILLSLMEHAGKGSWYLDKKLEPAITLLNNRVEKHREWYKPRAFTSEIEIDAELKPMFVAARDGKASALSGVKALAKWRFEWVGSLQRDASGKIQARLIDESLAQKKRSGKLFVIVANSQKKIEIHQIGSLNKGNLSLMDTPADLCAGRPVFAVLEPF